MLMICYNKIKYFCKHITLAIRRFLLSACPEIGSPLLKITGLKPTENEISKPYHNLQNKNGKEFYG